MSGNRFHTLGRRGSVESSLVVGLVGLLLLGGLSHVFVGSIRSQFFHDAPELDFLTTNAFRSSFVHTVVERGEVESSSNVEVRCEVQGRSPGVSILEIVPEGTWVEKGDFLVRLDNAELQNVLIQQQIACSNSEAAVIEAKAAMDSARLALREYSEGTYKEQLAQQQSAVFVAEENKRRAEEYVQYSKRLAERGYIPEAQLEADTFALEKSKKELGVAQTKLDVLRMFTREKMMTQLSADIETAEARLQSRSKSWQLDKVQLTDIRHQIEKCLIMAPVAGQVVYENNRGRSSSVLIEEGMPVRERQTIINLPDPSKMRVIAKIHESRISSVREGQSAELILDAMPEEFITGNVTEVSEYPLPAISSYMAHVKEYAVEIEIVDPPSDLRPGMTAEVRVLVDQLDDALQLPIEAVVERAGEFYCAVVAEDGSIAPRLLSVGLANETSLIVQSGLLGNEDIVLSVGEQAVLDALGFTDEDS